MQIGELTLHARIVSELGAYRLAAPVEVGCGDSEKLACRPFERFDGVKVLGAVRTRSARYWVWSSLKSVSSL